MRLFIFCLAFAVSTPIFSQSKKELLAQVDQLKQETEKLKAEIELLKKPKEVDLNDTVRMVSYGIGTFMASNLKTQGGDSLNLDALTAGITDELSNKKLRIGQEELMPVIQVYMQQSMEKKATNLKAANDAFLENNKKVEGVKTTASGLQYKVINTGTGKAPILTDKVTVHYTGKLIDGSVFDSSVERNEPITFDLNGVIPGWTEALQLMHEGDKWILYLPHAIGYGERGAGDQIPPYATLIFEVELIKVN